MFPSDFSILIVSLLGEGLAYAAAPHSQGAQNQAPGIVLFAPLLIVALIVYFFFVRPRQKGMTSSSSPSAHTEKPKQIQALLVLSQRPILDSQTLLQQIVDQQRSRGHSIAPNFIAKAQTAGSSFGDKAYAYSAIRATFSHLGGHDLINLTQYLTFQGSDGNQGEYYMVFDRL